MLIPIEDTFVDVIKKAAVGLGLGHSTLAADSGLSVPELRRLLNGEPDEGVLRQLAPVLNLNADKLVSMSKEEWRPRPVKIAELVCLNMPFPGAGYEGASVNCFLIVDKDNRQAVAFDTGTSAEPILNYLRSERLNLQALYLTHTHHDHTAGYAGILDATGCQAYAPSLEPYRDALLVEPGARMRVASYEIEARLTNGHSPGGLTYVVEGLEQGVAIVGDSIFCLSQGGAKQAYQLALENNRTQILTLPSSTVICPGHGPMTTVAEELAHNPFF